MHYLINDDSYNIKVLINNQNISSENIANNKVPFLIEHIREFEDDDNKDNQFNQQEFEHEISTLIET